jgi:hypothetical protein
MRLPPFLEFLRPRIAEKIDDLAVYGHLRVERTAAGGRTELICDDRNYIVDQGLTVVRDMLLGATGGGIDGSIFRMAIGDGGSTVGALYVPKLPDATWSARTELYEEVIRQDMAAFSTPSTVGARFVGNFNSMDVDDSSFTLPEKVINEAALIIGDGVLTVGGDKKQVKQGDVIDADEKLFSTRTFKSAPFDPAEDVTLSLTWTITVAR